MRPEYTVSQDEKGYWYAHLAGRPDIPVCGTFSKKRKHAEQYAAWMMGLTLRQYRERKNGNNGSVCNRNGEHAGTVGASVCGTAGVTVHHADAGTVGYSSDVSPREPAGIRNQTTRGKGNAEDATGLCAGFGSDDASNGRTGRGRESGKADCHGAGGRMDGGRKARD